MSAVKPLEWKPDTLKNVWPQRHRAITPIAEYTVSGSDGKDNWRWYRNGYSCGSGSLIERSMNSAMEAAFEHHVATLASCMKEPPAADFAAFMALAFPWLHEAGTDHKNLKAAWDAGWKAGRS